MGQIWLSAAELAHHLDKTVRAPYFQQVEGGVIGHASPWKVVATSGGFDPLHVGHLRCIQSSADLGDVLVVIVNGDGFLLRKKGYAFMPLDERLEIISGLAGVSHVLSWDDGSQTVGGALAVLRPDIFAKGGDRSSPSCIAPCELALCEQIGCRIAYGVGGSEKAQSSSALCSRFQAK